MAFPYQISKLWHRVRYFPLRIKSRLSGEIYFDKYDTGGAYHWKYYYENGDPFYTECVDTVCDLVPEHAHVLDIGCGDGLISNVLSEKKGCKVVGIDNQPLAITLARKKNRNANEFFVQSAYDISYQDVFDAVVEFEIFEHLRHPEVLLRKACDALKEAGVLVTSTPLANERKPPSRYHVKEYTKEEFLGYISEFFQVLDDRTVSRPDGKSDCYICLCIKRQSQLSRTK
jgi:2-polyprenyl-3-methyl-5-hydroxy-6-metoxy-1,4-benzoquinol methylase